MSPCLARPRDERWFRAVYHKNYRLLLAYARRRVDWSTADEVVAETFLTAWRRRDHIPDEQERPWLFGVARNTIRNANRASGRQTAVREKLRSLPNPALAESAPADSALADCLSEEVGERASVLRAALGRLSEADREVLMLVAWEELPHSEIAQMLGLTPNAVAIRVHRARKRFARQLDRLGVDQGLMKGRRRSGHEAHTGPEREGRAL